MAALPQNYDHQAREKHWQAYWLAQGTYHWDEQAPRDQTYVIDTPPPTVSGLLHMGHIFSYTQADFIARFQRMKGKTVFYPMGFDDNGLPTERLVEKTKKIRATDMSREDFIAECMSVSQEARAEFRRLFESTALSVDWRQEYHTISEESRRISQLSFLDLFRKDEVYRKLQPMLWDPVDQTAIAQAEVEDKELPSTFNDIRFQIQDSGEFIVIGTTRPELIPACVAVFYHPDDERYQHLQGKHAITPLFGVKVPILTDDTVEPEKGTGIMMCCTFGDEKDIEKWRKHDLPTRVVLNKYGKMDFTNLHSPPAGESKPHGGFGGGISSGTDDHLPPPNPPSKDLAPPQGGSIYEALSGLKVSNTDPKHPGARQKILQILSESGDLVESRPITHPVKCAERSGAPLEILPTYQWFVKVLDKKDALKEKAAECNWHPEWMKIRMDQWIDGLNWDWCISRQRYFGVPFPVWYVCETPDPENALADGYVLVPNPEDLPVNPLRDVPRGYRELSREGNIIGVGEECSGRELFLIAEQDVMDTWATSSISPQLSSKGINPSVHEPAEPTIESYIADIEDGYRQSYVRQMQWESVGGLNDPLVLDGERHAKLFPADLRPQAHEIIRTWAFYTLVKSYLHEGTIPWKNLMISGWCLASDKTKMSKSKGNVVTPVELIEEKGTDAVRYWASTSRLGADTAFSEDALKIGRKLVTKLWNAAKLSATLMEGMSGTPTTAAQDAERGIITETLDKWLICKLQLTIEKATKSFDAYEYADARAAVEDWFWNDFCDHYLELIKARAYGNDTQAAQQSALYTLHHCLNGVLKLFAPIIPHITEELFSYLYPQELSESATGSIHDRGMWPAASHYMIEPPILSEGAACISLLNAIRKAKSERGVSIKYPLDQVVISAAASQTLEADLWRRLPSLDFDLKSAGNVSELIWSEQPISGVPTEDGRFTLTCVFAPHADVA